jgi:hypothetical protein
MSDNRGVKYGESITPGLPGANKHATFYPQLDRPLLAEYDNDGTTWYYSKIFAMVLSANYTLSNVNTAQKAFDVGGNGRIALPGDSAYLFEALYLITNTGTAGHTWATLFDTNNGMTLTSLDYRVRGRTGITSAATLTADLSAYQQTGAGALPTTALVATASSTANPEHVIVELAGELRVNNGGNLIPQIKLSTATGVAATMLRGSYFKLTPIGDKDVVSVGSVS